MPLTPAEQYRIEEMKVARTRIDQEISAMNNFETISVAAIGAIYFLFFSQHISDQSALIVLSLLPVVICGYGIFRYRAHASIVQVHEDYLKSVELLFLNERGLVGHYDENKTGLLKQARSVFWVLIFFLSFAAFIVAVVCPQKLVQMHRSPTTTGIGFYPHD